MRSTGFLLALASLSTSSLASAHRDAFDLDHQHDFPRRSHELRELERRNILAVDASLADSYDFVIVGGGTAGLVLAARLSEDSNHTVLCLEAGDTGEAVASNINTPANTYYQSLLGSSYDWSFNTLAQSGANNRVLNWPRGKVLGGSSAINGMYIVRPSEPEVEAWASMVPDASSKWGWSSLFEGMQTSETFTPPTDAVQQAGNIQFNTNSRGSSGPVHSSYPGYMFPIVGTWTDTLANIGVVTNADAYSGEGWGAFVATSAINPTNWTRSYARTAYIDPLPPRSNLAILPNATVTRLIFGDGGNGSKNVTAVEYASSRTATRKTVKVNKEVILAAGTIGSPNVLLQSGVGPTDVLSSANVDVQIALPGVGQHLQDHISTQVSFKTSVDTSASLHSSNTLPDGATEAEFMSFINSATAYVNISDLVGADSYQAFHDSVVSALGTSASTLLPSQDPTVIAGYEAIYNATANFLLSPVGQVEILLSLTGTPQGAQTVAVQAALQHPLSQGHLYIASNDPFDAPVIDPAYLSHSADKTLFREGLKLARKIGQTASLASSTTNLVEAAPGSSVQTDDEWDAWIANAFGTEFHPSGSCAMLPLDQGGVVDADLKVYGTGNLRVVDASVFPVQFTAHLMAPVYGMAERAATFIRQEWNGVSFVSTNSSTSGNNSASGPGSSTSNQTSDDGGSSGGSSGASAASVPVLGALVSAALVLAAL